MDAVYVKLFNYDATKRHFVPRQSGYEGATPESLEALTLDHPLIAFRKQHLGRYLATLVTKPYDGKMVNYLDMVGKMHTPKAGSGGTQRAAGSDERPDGFRGRRLTAAIFGMGLERDGGGSHAASVPETPLDTKRSHHTPLPGRVSCLPTSFAYRFRKR